MKRHTGFTIIELMVIIVIIGILVAIAMPMFQEHKAEQELLKSGGVVSVNENGFEITPMGSPTPSYEHLIQPTLIVKHDYYRIFRYETDHQVCSYATNWDRELESISCTQKEENE